jgi:Protein of unknown function (DUF559)
MSMSFDSAIQPILQRQSLVITRAQVLAAGGTDRMIATRVRNGLWHRLMTSVYLVGPPDPSWRSLGLAATLGVHASVASHESAAQLHAMSFVPTGRRIITVPQGGTNRCPFARVHESRWLPPEHITTVDGITATTRVRTALDLSAVLSWRRHERMIDDELSTDRLTIPDLVDGFTHWTRRGRRRSARVRLLLEARGEGYIAPRSELEARYLSVVAGSAFADPVRQFLMPWRLELPGRVDFAYPSLRLIVEVDGRRWHSRDQAREIDIERDNEATVHGWLVLHFSWRHVTQDPAYVRATLAQILHTAA